VTAVQEVAAPTAGVSAQVEVKTKIENQTPMRAEPLACPMLLPWHGPDSRGCGNALCPSRSGHGGDQNLKLKSCLCHDIEYCSKGCQKQDWTEHRATCTTAKANDDADWMAKVARRPGQKRVAMHGTKVVPSKCLECKRTISVEPDVEYVK
jgi:hypothetical protein